MGMLKLPCTYLNPEHFINFIIANKNVSPILGLLSCIKLKIITEVHSVMNMDKDNFFKQNGDLFVGIGKFSKKRKLKWKRNYQPVTRPSRRVPVAIRDRLEEQLDDLEKRGIITEFDEPDGWLSNFVIVENPIKPLDCVCIYVTIMKLWIDNFVSSLLWMKLDQNYKICHILQFEISIKSKI